MKQQTTNNKLPDILEELYLVIENRSLQLKKQLATGEISDKDRLKLSYTQQLLLDGLSRISQKVGEEAVETVIASLKGSKKDLIEESVDLLYHLLVLWQVSDIKPKDIYKEIESRSALE